MQPPCEYCRPGKACILSGCHVCCHCKRPLELEPGPTKEEPHRKPKWKSLPSS